MGRWLGGILILAIIALLLSVIGPWSATKNSTQMGKSIQSALNAGGYDFANVNMSGNVAKLTGTAPNEDAAMGAVATAKGAKCEACKDRDDRWHVVENTLDVKKAPPPPPPPPAIPTQSPYTFTAVKTDNGVVVLDGYVRSNAERDAVLVRAQNLFGNKYRDQKVRVAKGAPNGQWVRVIETNLDELNYLEKGRVTMEDTQVLISGEAKDEDIRNQINEMVGTLPESYNTAANITVPNKAADNVGEVKSESICQSLFDELKGDNKINFASAKAAIRGAKSFDLLNSLASAAKQCASFKVEIAGHTDADGPDEANQYLSEARAGVVKAYLVENGIEADRVTAIGYGEAKPIASNDNAAGKAQNRRIEFTVTQSN